MFPVLLKSDIEKLLNTIDRTKIKDKHDYINRAIFLERKHKTKLVVLKVGNNTNNTPFYKIESLSQWEPHLVCEGKRLPTPFEQFHTEAGYASYGH